MSKKHVVTLTRRWPGEVEAHLAELYDVHLNGDDHPLSVAELQGALAESDALCPTVSDRIDAEVLETESCRARILGNFGVGFNHIDLKATRRRELVVTNTPEVLTDCTADLAMALLLAAARRLGEGERCLRAGQWGGWRPTHMLATRVSGKTLGLVGFGRIARAVARRAHHGFGMRILFHDPQSPSPEAMAEVQAEARDSLETLLAEADFVSLHCPGGKQTRHLMNADRLNHMQRGAFLINTARGDVVDEAALVEVLRKGHLAGAGLDVYEQEPRVHPELLHMEQVLLAPHLGSASRETRVAMGMRVLSNLQAFFEGRPPPDRVA